MTTTNNWTPEQAEDLYRYGLCPHCGRPRRLTMTMQNDTPISMELGCWNEDCNLRLPYPDEPTTAPLTTTYVVKTQNKQRNK